MYKYIRLIKKFLYLNINNGIMNLNEIKNKYLKSLRLKKIFEYCLKSLNNERSEK